MSLYSKPKYFRRHILSRDIILHLIKNKQGNQWYNLKVQTIS